LRFPLHAGLEARQRIIICGAMRILNNKKLWAIFTVVVALNVSLAQQSHEDSRAIEAKLLNVPSATYKLKAFPNGKGYQFCNNSSLDITRFRLGCAKKKAGELLILEERPFIEADLESKKDTVQCYSRRSFHGFLEGYCKKGKLAVTEVDFADGTVWKLKP